MSGRGSPTLQIAPWWTARPWTWPNFVDNPPWISSLDRRGKNHSAFSINQAFLRKNKKNESNLYDFDDIELVTLKFIKILYSPPTSQSKLFSQHQNPRRTPGPHSSVFLPPPTPVSITAPDPRLGWGSTRVHAWVPPGSVQTTPLYI